MASGAAQVGVGADEDGEGGLELEGVVVRAPAGRHARRIGGRAGLGRRPWRPCRGESVAAVEAGCDGRDPVRAAAAACSGEAGIRCGR